MITLARTKRIAAIYLSCALAFGSLETADLVAQGIVQGLAGVSLAAVAVLQCGCATALADNISVVVTIDGPDEVTVGTTNNYTAHVTVSGHSKGGSTYCWSLSSTDGGYLYPTTTNSVTTIFMATNLISSLSITCDVIYTDYTTTNHYPASGSKTIEVNNRDYRRAVIRSSKPAIWVNYADPRPKGNDDDKGAKPSCLPSLGVNNVSLMPGVSHPVLDVAVPVGAVGMSPVLSYSPPTLSRSQPTGNPSITFSVSATPSEFGNCWSWNLTPCIEMTASRASEGTWKGWEFSTSVDGPVPSASFDGGYADSFDSTDSDDPFYSPSTWTNMPLCRATFTPNFYGPQVKFWGSGIVVDATDNNYDDLETYETGHLTSYSLKYWPGTITDRNTIETAFSYGDPASTNMTSFSAITCAENPCDATWTKIRPLSSVSRTVSNELFSVATALSNNFFVTNITSTLGSTPLRSVQLSYCSPTDPLADPADSSVKHFYVTLLNRVTFPDGTCVEYQYTNVQYAVPYSGYATFNLPYLSAIVTTAGTTRIHYSGFGWFGSDEQKRFEPGSVTVIHDDGLTQEVYEKGGCSYTYSYQHPASSHGSASMTTTTDNATVNIKDYTLTLDPSTKQWYGVELANTLDGIAQNKYAADSRFRFTCASNSPNGTAWCKTQFAYDAFDNLVEVTDALNNVASNEFANEGMDLVWSKDPRGTITEHEYDGRGNRTRSIEDVGGIARVSSNEFNIAGQAIRSIDPLLRSSYSFYSVCRTPTNASAYVSSTPSTSNCGWLVASRDPLNRVTTYTYDCLGRKIKIDSPGNTSSARYILENEYDSMDRLICTRFPDGTFVSNVYNVAGYPVKAFDRAGRMTTNTYDAAGHVLSVHFPNGDWVEKQYAGNLVTNLADAAGNNTAYFYDHEQLTFVAFPDGSTRAAGFDNLNKQMWAVDERGVAVTNAYDALGRLIRTEHVPFVSTNSMPPTVTELPSGCSPTTCQWNLVYGGFTNYSHCVAFGYDENGNVT